LRSLFPQVVRVDLSDLDPVLDGEAIRSGWRNVMHAAAVEVEASEAALVALEMDVLVANFADDLCSAGSRHDAAGREEALSAAL
jgi:hypothetical protein